MLKRKRPKRHDTTWRDNFTEQLFFLVDKDDTDRFQSRESLDKCNVKHLQMHVNSIAVFFFFIWWCHLFLSHHHMLIIVSLWWYYHLSLIDDLHESDYLTCLLTAVLLFVGRKMKVINLEVYIFYIHRKRSTNE